MLVVSVMIVLVELLMIKVGFLVSLTVLWLLVAVVVEVLYAFKNILGGLN